MSYTKDKIHFMGASMDTSSMESTVSRIETSIFSQNFMQHCVVNVAKLVNMQKDTELANSVNSCDLINIDGMGVVWGARFCGYTVSERVTGVDLFHNLIAMSANSDFPVFLLGATDEVLTKTVEVIKTKNPKLKIAGYHHGYFWDDEETVVDKIQKSGAKLLFIAITSPKKENFINKWQGKLGVNFVMGVGGTFDVVAGKVKRAPVWMQSYGLEWLYRVIQEPGRMWKRYLITNSKFVYLLIKEKFKFK